MQSCKILFLLLLWVAGGSAFGQDSLKHKIKLVFAGDIMGHDSQIASAQVRKDSLYDYSPCFEYVAPILQEADLAIGNLELTLPGKGPFTGYPRFRSPDDLALALRHAGFDLLLTANNHSNDGGLIGVQNTIHTLRSYFFYQTGTFLNKMERDVFYPLIVYKGVFKLALLNYTYGTNGLPTPNPTIVNEIDEETIQKDLAEARAMQPDLLLVVMHWGNEYQLNESKQQSDLARKLFEWGADVVVGAHPHVIQPVKTMTVTRPDSSSFTGLVAYSLGNFISGQRKKFTDLGLLFELELEKDMRTGVVSVSDHHYLPVYRHIEQDQSGKRIYRVLPVSAFEEADKSPLLIPESTRKAMLATTKTIRTHLAKYQSSERKIILPLTEKKEQ